MKTFSEYYQALMTESEEEQRFNDLIRKENERFENTVEYLEHKEHIHELYEDLHNAFVKRMASVKEERPKREKIVNGSFRKSEIPHKEYTKEMKDAISAVEKLSDREKRTLWFNCMRDEIPFDESKKIDDGTMHELHNILVQTVIDYINEKGLRDVDAISFSADGLVASAEYGEWTPSTDSFLTLEGITEEEYVSPDGEKIKAPSRVEIGKSY